MHTYGQTISSDKPIQKGILDRRSRALFEFTLAATQRNDVQQHCLHECLKSNLTWLFCASTVRLASSACSSLILWISSSSLDPLWSLWACRTCVLDMHRRDVVQNVGVPQMLIKQSFLLHFCYWSEEHQRPSRQEFQILFPSNATTSIHTVTSQLPAYAKLQIPSSQIFTWQCRTDHCQDRMMAFCLIANRKVCKRLCGIKFALLCSISWSLHKA